MIQPFQILVVNLDTVKIVVPVSIEFGCPFFTGLSTVMTGNVNITVIYE